MIGDAVTLDHGDEIGLRVAAQRRSAEVRIAGEESIRRTMKIGEIATPAAGDQDLGADFTAWSSNKTFLPRWPAVRAQMSPAAPARE